MLLPVCLFQWKFSNGNTGSPSSSRATRMALPFHSPLGTEASEITHWSWSCASVCSLSLPCRTLGRFFVEMRIHSTNLGERQSSPKETCPKLSGGTDALAPSDTGRPALSKQVTFGLFWASVEGRCPYFLYPPLFNTQTATTYQTRTYVLCAKTQLPTRTSRGGGCLNLSQERFPHLSRFEKLMGISETCQVRQLVAQTDL